MRRLRLFLLACLCVCAGCRREEPPAFQGISQAAYVWRQGWDSAAAVSLTAGDLPAEVNRTLDIGGPEVLKYSDMMNDYAVEAGMKERAVLRLPRRTQESHRFHQDRFRPPGLPGRPGCGGALAEPDAARAARSPGAGTSAGVWPPAVDDGSAGNRSAASPAAVRLGRGCACPRRR
jgi:hypothetical protein